MKRVAAYCRVSTEQDDQLNSLENQKQFFERYINQNPEWRFCGLYVDEGITGTNVNKRAGFKRMITDAEARRFDMILTKEISRFARNTLDSIYYTRKLKEVGVGVFFLNDNINTLEPDAELRLTIMSSIAQEESRKTSQRVRWGQKRQMEKGVVFGVRVYGYHLKDGKLTVNGAEAEVVRLIFHLCLEEGMGARLICLELENRGIPSPSGGARWKNASVLRMLKNEKYIGVLKQKKHITTDYLSHRKKINEGEEEYIVIGNNHTPIVSRAVFDRVQRELERRRTTIQEKSKHSNRYAWSGRIKCGLCGATFKRKMYNTKSPNPQIVWLCSEAARYGAVKVNGAGQTVGCDCKAIHESFLREAFADILTRTVDTGQITAELKDAVRQALADTPDMEPERASLQRDITRAEYDRMSDRYGKHMETLLESLAALDRQTQLAEEPADKLKEIDTAIESLAGLSEWSESVCREVLEKIVVDSREKITYYFKPPDYCQTADVNCQLSIVNCQLSPSPH